MRRATEWANVVLGLIFILVPLNQLFHFIDTQPVGAETPAFIKAMVDTGYLWTLLKIVEISAGVLALAGWGPLSVLILAPVVVNIFAFHLFLNRTGLPFAAVILALELFQLWRYREIYAEVLKRHRK